MMADTSKLPISRVDELIDKLNEINNNFNIINNKLDSMKYVIESGSNENNTQWYRKWNDGWIEQGGIYNYGSFIKDLGGANINFLINFSNVNYQIFATSFRTDRDNEGNGLCTAMDFIHLKMIVLKFVGILIALIMNQSKWLTGMLVDIKKRGLILSFLSIS